MNYEQLFPELRRRRIRVALSGAKGSFGRSLLAQCRHIPAIDVVAACDLDPEGTRALLAELGYPPGTVGVVRDHAALADSDFDILVEATGQPEPSFQMAAAAIRRGIHVAMVSKETDSVAGLWLSRMAQARGVVYTTADGDQPSTLIGLVTWARLLGFEVIAAGKAGEYDLVFDPSSEELIGSGGRRRAGGFGGLWRLDSPATGTLGQRAAAAEGLVRPAPPDACEMGMVANATGLEPASPGLNYPLCRVPELADVFIPRAEGGILDREGVVDTFHCLRRPDEVSFSGGVFVIVRCGDEVTWRLLRQKGHIVSRNLKFACLYRPLNLLGLEAPMTLFSAVLHGRASGSPEPAARTALVARAERDFQAGETLAMGGHHHVIEGMSARLLPGGEAAGKVPYYLAAHRRLRRAVPAGDYLAAADLDLDGSALAAAWLER